MSATSKKHVDNPNGYWVVLTARRGSVFGLWVVKLKRPVNHGVPQERERREAQKAIERVRARLRVINDAASQDMLNKLSVAYGATFTCKPFKDGADVIPLMEIV
jgi:hypothetical protein